MVSFVGIILASVLLALGVVLVMLGRTLRLSFRREESLENTFEDTTSLVNRMVRRVAAMTEGTGIELLPRELVLLSVVAGSVLFLGSQVMGMALGTSLVLGIVGLAGLPLYVFLQRGANAGKFEDQLGAAMPLIASNLRAGLTLRQALVPVAENMKDPIRTEFFRLADEVSSGTPMPAALDALADRANSDDLRLFATAVSIQTTQGGSIADITEQVGATVRMRAEMRQFVKSKTSMATISTLVMTAAPVLVFIAMMAMSEIHREFYLSLTGMMVLGLCLILNALGWLIMRVMSKIE